MHQPLEETSGFNPCVTLGGEKHTLDRLQEIYHSNRKKLRGIIREFTNYPFRNECRKYIQNFMTGGRLLKLQRCFPSDPYNPHEIFPDLEDDKAARVVGAVTDIIDQIAKKLPIKHNFLKGGFVMVGSFRDGTKTGSVDEFDFVYVLESIDRSQLKLQKQSDVAYKVLIDDEQISSCNYYELFSIAIKEIMTGVHCPAGMEHGGLAHPEFSSVRFNGPAVTLLFLWRREKISVDLTLAIPVTLALERDVISSIEPIIDELGMTSCDMEGKVHLIPMYPDEENWYISTSQLEADLLHAQHPRCEFKVTIRMIKSLQQSFVADMWKDAAWLDTELCRELFGVEHGDLGVKNHVTDRLEVYAASSVDDKRNQQQGVSRAMEYGHHQLSAEKAQLYGEVTKPCVVLNSSGIKYKRFQHIRSITEGENLSELFKGVYCPDKTVLNERMMHVLERNAKHPFLAYDVCMFSVAGYAANVCHPLVSIAQEQCLFVAEHYHRHLPHRLPRDSQPFKARKRSRSTVLWSIPAKPARQPLPDPAKHSMPSLPDRDKDSRPSLPDPRTMTKETDEIITTGRMSATRSPSTGQELPEALKLITKYKHLMRVNSRIVKDIKALDPMWKEPGDLNVDIYGYSYFQIEGAHPPLFSERRSAYAVNSM